MNNNVTRVHFDGLDKHADDFLAFLDNYQKINNLKDSQIFLALQYVMCSLLALFLNEKDLSSNKRLIKKIVPIFDEMVEKMVTNREGYKDIILGRE